MEACNEKHTILFVDDEVHILSSLKRAFRKEGYNILTTDNGEEALEFFKDNNISLIISDQRMPVMSGVELLSRAKKISPETIRIMLTGYADIKAAVAAINKGEVYRFIGKPWNDDDIKMIVRHALQQIEMKRENERLKALTEKQNGELKVLNSSLEQKVRERTKEIELKNTELAKLYKELKTSFFETIKVMVGLMELLNPPLGGHSKRVAAMSKKIAKMMGLGSNEISLVEVAGLLHDVGLMGLPANIIKHGMKTSNEREKKIYNQHPEMGYATLNLIKELKQVAVLVKSHHERFDGKGFPGGLASEEIPLGARIIAVADTYDEITYSKEYFSERSGRQKALEHIKVFKGHKFDPVIVNYFYKYLEDAKELAGDELVVRLNELAVGMLLSRDIFTKSGKLLLTRNTTLEAVHIERIGSFNKVDPIRGDIYIFQNR